MKRYLFGGVCAAAGFAAALWMFPAAQGASNTTAYRQLDLFSDAFERVRANYVTPITDQKLNVEVTPSKQQFLPGETGIQLVGYNRILKSE